MSDTPATPPLSGRHANGRFGPGNPGRPHGARGRAAHGVTLAILEDFMEHKESALNNARFSNPGTYLNAIVKLLPTQAAPEPTEVRDWSDADVEAALDRARAALDGSGDGRDALIELEAVLLGEDPAERLPARAGHRK
jgi:hypothetical protein